MFALKYVFYHILFLKNMSMERGREFNSS